MAVLADPDQTGAGLPYLVPEPEAVATVTLAFVSWEADPWSLVLATLGLAVGCQGSTEVNGRFLEGLCRHLMPPFQTRCLHSEEAIRAGNEDAAGGLAVLPGVEGVDQIEPRPRNQGSGVCPLGGKCVNDQP
jgi:hypothetical protein